MVNRSDSGTKEYTREDSSLPMSGREGSIILFAILGALQPCSSSVGGTNISGSDREVVELTGWGTFRSSEVIIGLTKGKSCHSLIHG